jgi:hypothetical protein
MRSSCARTAALSRSRSEFVGRFFSKRRASASKSILDKSIARRNSSTSAFLSRTGISPRFVGDDVRHCVCSAFAPGFDPQPRLH